ncbi:MAG: hypothetical protein EBS42_10610 [Caulobacteraceae bacterium]|nr:hypothetical protein [Caulobacteraceae bacterium]
MIYRLEIENFYSVRDQQVLDLTIAPNVPDPDGRFAPLFPGSELRAPKVVALYGPNASGKTNVLRALDFIMNFVRDSSQRTVPGFPCDRFNDEASRNRPIRLAFEFGGVMDLSPETLHRLANGEAVQYGLYRYELILSVADGTPSLVQSEALRQKPEGKGKWQRVFERVDKGDVLAARSFGMSGYRHLLNTLRPNVSVLSSFAFFQHPTAKLFVDLARTVIGVMNSPQDDQGLVKFLAQEPDLVSRLNRDLRRIDLGVEAMKFVESASGPMPMFRHEGLEVDMPWLLQSHGTRAFIRLFPLISLTLQRGGVAIIDEFDTYIHALVLPQLLSWFYDRKTRNPQDAQIWLSCHSASLLDDLVKEEVVLCEKDSLGRTRAFSLMDMKSVRRDENLYRKYLSGVYGAVPQLA